MSSSTNPYYSIRAIATRHKIGTAVVAGLVATHMATMWGYWFHGIGLPVLDWNTTNGIQLLPEASHNVQFFTGAAAHYTTGVCFALLFAFGPHWALPLRDTLLGNLGKAIAFGLLLGFLSALIMVPLVFYPDYHPGFFSHNLGFKGVLSIFVWHAIYGVHLGAIYTPLPEDEVIESRGELEGMSVSGPVADPTRVRAAALVGE
jgi:hypothetical protein